MAIMMNPELLKSLPPFTHADKPAGLKPPGMTVAELRKFLYFDSGDEKFDGDPRGPDTAEVEVDETGQARQVYAPEPAPARAYQNSAFIEKSPELSPHEWGETTRPMGEAERERLAAFGRGIPAGGEVALTEGAVHVSVGNPVRAARVMRAVDVNGVKSWIVGHRNHIIVAGCVIGFLALASGKSS